MKLSSKVLAGSLASAGMVLSLVAPALTAQAATTSGVVGTDGSTVEAVSPDKEIGALPGNKQLAIAYDGTTGSDSSAVTGSGKATATSNAAVNVISGVLVLNEVPDFNFGTAVSGQTKNLVDNTKDTSTMSDANKASNIDGNAQGNLSVLESRDTSSAAGFNLSAQLGAFTQKDGTAAGNTDPFVLNLASVPVTDGSKQIDDGATGLTTTVAPLSSGIAAGSLGDAATILNVKKGDAAYQDGEYLAQFTKADSTVSPAKDAGATLKVPSLGGDKTTAKVTSLNAPIVWTLSAAPTAK